jgi:hypothetical protein
MVDRSEQALKPKAYDHFDVGGEEPGGLPRGCTSAASYSQKANVGARQVVDHKSWRAAIPVRVRRRGRAQDAKRRLPILLASGCSTTRDPWRGPHARPRDEETMSQEQTN